MCFFFCFQGWRSPNGQWTVPSLQWAATKSWNCSGNRSRSGGTFRLMKSTRSFADFLFIWFLVQNLGPAHIFQVVSTLSKSVGLVRMMGLLCLARSPICWNGWKIWRGNGRRGKIHGHGSCRRPQLLQHLQHHPLELKAVECHHHLCPVKVVRKKRRVTRATLHFKLGQANLLKRILSLNQVLSLQPGAIGPTLVVHRVLGPPRVPRCQPSHSQPSMGTAMAGGPRCLPPRLRTSTQEAVQQLQQLLLLAQLSQLEVQVVQVEALEAAFQAAALAQAVLLWVLQRHLQLHRQQSELAIWAPVLHSRQLLRHPYNFILNAPCLTSRRSNEIKIASNNVLWELLPKPQVFPNIESGLKVSQIFKEDKVRM